MTDAHNTTNSCIDTEPTTPEPSPSVGWRETYDLLGAELPGDPVDAVGCGALGCHTDEPLYRVPTDAGDRVLCPDHAADALDRVRA